MCLMHSESVPQLGFSLLTESALCIEHKPGNSWQEAISPHLVLRSISNLHLGHFWLLENMTQTHKTYPPLPSLWGSSRCSLSVRTGWNFLCVLWFWFQHSQLSFVPDWISYGEVQAATTSAREMSCKPTEYEDRHQIIWDIRDETLE